MFTAFLPLYIFPLLLYVCFLLCLQYSSLFTFFHYFYMSVFFTVYSIHPVYIFSLLLYVCFTLCLQYSFLFTLVLGFCFLLCLQYSFLLTFFNFIYIFVFFTVVGILVFLQCCSWSSQYTVLPTVLFYFDEVLFSIY